MSRMKKNKQWEQMQQILKTAGDEVYYCSWWCPGEGHDLESDIECWFIQGMPTLFLIHKEGGFNVYTSPTPEELDDVDKVLPWLIKKAEEK